MVSNTRNHFITNGQTINPLLWVYWKLFSVLSSEIGWKVLKKKINYFISAIIERKNYYLTSKVRHLSKVIYFLEPTRLITILTTRLLFFFFPSNKWRLFDKYFRGQKYLSKRTDRLRQLIDFTNNNLFQIFQIAGNRYFIWNELNGERKWIEHSHFDRSLWII